MKDYRRRHAEVRVPCIQLNGEPTWDRAVWAAELARWGAARFGDAANSGVTQAERLRTWERRADEYLVRVHSTGGALEARMGLYEVITALGETKSGKAGGADDTVAEHWKVLAFEVKAKLAAFFCVLLETFEEERAARPPSWAWLALHGLIK